MNAISNAVSQVTEYFLNNNMSIFDILDIVITAFVVYKIMGFISRTKSARIAQGIIFVILLLWISDRLQLHVVNFVLSRTIDIGILAIVVLFQPEIRRLLEQFGKSGFTKVLFVREESGKAMETAIMQTVVACNQMAKDKVGALIVFEREISLEDMIKTGTIINADVNTELLKNIFFNKAPLHDGAVIIRDGKIIAAGCVVPLSGNANLSRDLGMRHRAGIGTSEQSDAVTVIISEETGSISVAVDGMLKRHLAPETFEKLLRNELMSPTETDRKSGKLMTIIRGKRNVK